MFLNPAQWYEFDQALNDAYTIESFTRMLLQRMGRKLESLIIPTGSNFPEVISVVMGRANNDGWMPEFIRAACGYVPGNQFIKDFVAKYPEFVTPPSPVVDPYDACLLRAKRIFINRKGLRQLLRELGQPIGPRVLIVNGERATGKTYTLHMISYLAMKIPSQKTPVYVDLDEYQYTPVELAEEIGLQMGRNDLDTLPKQYDEQMVRWNRKLCAWIVGGIAREAMNTWWFIFDGFREKKPLPETVDFIERLTVLIEQTVTRLRLILLNYTEALPLNIDSYIGREKIEPIGRTDLESFFKQFATEAAQSYTETGISNVIDEILRQVEEKVAPLQDGNEKRLEFLNIAVVKAVQDRRVFEQERQ